MNRTWLNDAAWRYFWHPVCTLGELHTAAARRPPLRAVPLAVPAPDGWTCWRRGPTRATVHGTLNVVRRQAAATASGGDGKQRR